MVFIMTLPVEKQQQHLSVSSIDMHNFYSYSGLKTNIIRIYTWVDRFRMTYIMLSGACIYGFFWLPLMDKYAVDSLIQSSAINDSSTTYTRYQRAYAERCSLSLTSPVNNISSHIYMNILTIFLCYVFVISFLPMNISHSSIPKDHLENSHRAFVSYRNVFICLAVCCMSNQLISAFACRSIDILYNIRFTSMIILQTIGFFACLLFAFFLGIKYASLNHGYY